MADTYTQIHIHFVFAVKYRAALIDPRWKDELHKYITGIFQHNGHKMIQINSVPDHIHILAGIRPHQAISQLIQNVKTESSKWIKENKLCKTPFAWQQGYGAFACSREHLKNAINYIRNQEQHHAARSFTDEYKAILSYLEIEWQEQHIFTSPL